MALAGLFVLRTMQGHYQTNEWRPIHDPEGNARASAAVADIDVDGQLEVVLPVGCYGRIYAYDGLTGAPEWQLQLGPRAQNSPSIGDLDGDGAAEIVVGSYDGYVWVLGGGARNYLPLVER